VFQCHELIVGICTAWKSADFLQRLLENGAIHSEPNDVFAELYPEESVNRVVEVVNEKGLNNSSETGSSSGAKKKSNEWEKEGELLLSSKNVSAVVQLFTLQDRAMVEIMKALEQAATRLQKARKD
jgi:hypothetical protein